MIPVYNEESNIMELCSRIFSVTSKLNHNQINIVFVDDGSKDETEARILEAKTKYFGRVGLIKLKRNFGHQSAIIAGINQVTCDAVITMDGDLQHPVEYIVKMIEVYEQGNVDVVQMVRQGTPKDVVGLISRLFYGFVNFIEGKVVVFDGADFRLMGAPVLRALKEIPEKEKFLRGLLPKLGFRIRTVNYLQSNRFSGHSSYTFRQLSALGLAPLTKYSSVTARITILIALACLCMSPISYCLSSEESRLILFCLFGLLGLNFVFIALVFHFFREVLKQLEKHPEYEIDTISLPGQLNP